MRVVGHCPVLRSSQNSETHGYKSATELPALPAMLRSHNRTTRAGGSQACLEARPNPGTKFVPRLTYVPRAAAYGFVRLHAGAHLLAHSLLAVRSVHRLCISICNSRCFAPM